MATRILQQDVQAKKNVKERWKSPHPTLESKFKLINLGDHSLLLTWRSLPTGTEGCKQPWQFMRSQSISQCHRVQSLKSRLKRGYGDKYLYPCECISPVRSWSMPTNTHDATFDMEWKYLTMRAETGCRTKTELLFKDMEHPRWSWQGIITIKASETPRGSWPKGLSYGSIISFQKEQLPHLEEQRKLARWPRHSKDILRRGFLAHSLPSQERCIACKRKELWLIACLSHKRMWTEREEKIEKRQTKTTGHPSAVGSHFKVIDIVRRIDWWVKSSQAFGRVVAGSLLHCDKERNDIEQRGCLKNLGG